MSTLEPILQPVLRDALLPDRQYGGSAPAPSGQWILTTGSWSDSGEWDDADTWRDA